MRAIGGYLKSNVSVRLCICLMTAEINLDYFTTTLIGMEKSPVPFRSVGNSTDTNNFSVLGPGVMLPVFMSRNI